MYEIDWVFEFIEFSVKLAKDNRWFFELLRFI